MSDLHWFSGIGWDTPVRQIGWTWVLLAVAVIIVVRSTVSLVRDLRSRSGRAS